MSSSFKLRSHPQKPLEVHLTNVAELSKKTVLGKHVDKKELYSEIAFLTGTAHDFAKSTTYFQNYLNDHQKTERAYHGLLSSIFGYYSIDSYLKRNEVKDSWYLAPITWLVILRHHGNIKNIGGIGGEARKLKEGLDVLKKQILDIKENNLDEITNIYSKWNINVVEFFKEFDKIISSIKKDLKKLSKGQGPQYYFLILFFYSVLLDADKMDASETKVPNRLNISEEIVDKFKKANFKDNDSDINKIREEAYLDAVNSLKDLNLNKDKILSLNLPTGCGKTLTGLSFSLKLRKKIEDELGFTPKIIYSLPFLSIIDQNADVFSEILSFEPNEMKKIEDLTSLPSNLILKHHHLSEMIYKTEDELEISTGRSKLLIEGWYSELVITTFIQLFYSLITNKNSAARKFHNIVNSIILLDEIQSIPYHYWDLLNVILKHLSEEYNCWIMLITATQPLIFKENIDIKPIITNKEKYFNEFNRISYKFNMEAKNFDDFKELVWNKIISEPKKDIMVVLNTINASQDLYQFIKDQIKEEVTVDNIGIANFNDSRLINLSTLIIPDHRLKRIKSIKNDNQKRNIIITTQVVEAGVDISVDILYRDMAPLDSIVQAAGRCNRNNEKDNGLTEIYVLSDNGGRNYYSYVYSSTLISATNDVINGNFSTEESEFNIYAVPQYYNFVLERGSQDKSGTVVSYLEKLRFSDFKSEFKLIDDNFEKIDVFIEIDEKAIEIREKYNILEIENRFQRKNEFLKIKPDFYNYVISVNPKKLGKVISDTEWPVYIDYGNLDMKYNLETGFIPVNKEDVFII